MSADEMMRSEIAKKQSPKRSRLVIAGASLGVVLLAVGGFFGVKAANDYRSEIEASQAAAEDARADALEIKAQTQQLVDEAAASAEAAQEAVDSKAAAEDAAAAVAAAQAATNVSNGLTPEGKCPAGTTAGEVREDGTEGLCSPTGPSGQPCAEYTDNVCTAWLKP
jgi:hypothetical protein